MEVRGKDGEFDVYVSVKADRYMELREAVDKYLELAIKYSDLADKYSTLVMKNLPKI